MPRPALLVSKLAEIITVLRHFPDLGPWTGLDLGPERWSPWTRDEPATVSRIDRGPILARVDQKQWDELKAAATAVAAKAYAPYSKYRVGAAALVDDGRVVVGCNVENAGYGVTLCAECGLIGQLHATGGGRLTHFVCVNGNGDVIMPCGRCRQILFEHGGNGLVMWTVSGIKTMAEVLPDAFGPDDLEAGR